MSRSIRTLSRQIRTNVSALRGDITRSPACSAAARISSRQFSDVAEASSSKDVGGVTEDASRLREGWLFIDSVLPVQLGIWDLRYFLAVFRQETLVERLQYIFSTVQANGFRVLEVSPYSKDGGVFVKFSYTAVEQEPALDSILKDFREKANKLGGVPSWFGISRGNIWLVKGKPWREDMRRYASPILKVSFDGPDVQEESLYELLRPYGRIEEITRPTPVPAGTLRSSTVAFRRVRAAVVAHNAINNISIPSALNASTVTRLRTNYEVPIQAHVVRNYVASHPRIFLPVLFFLIGTLTYTIFDPLRVLMVEGKMQDWFNFEEFRIFKWLRNNTLDRFYITPTAGVDATTSSGDVWKERNDAETALNQYLADMPTTVAFVHGPQGSGKSSLISAILKERGRKALVIDVAEFSKANSEVKLVSTLAQQTGYWPVLSVFNSMNNLIDVASVGLIGQKAGLSSSLTDQIKQVLEVVGNGLTRVNAAHRKERQHAVKREHVEELRKSEGARVMSRIKEGHWHDGRLDYVAGTGLISELGVGDESFGQTDVPLLRSLASEKEVEGKEKEKEKEEAKRKQKSVEDLRVVESMPIVIVKGFGAKGSWASGASKEVILDELARWAATLVENQIAHVVVVSDNRENAKRLARALPSQPLHTIKLSDADNASALSFMKQKLHDSGVEIDFTRQQRTYVERLGGRASDLESLINKLRNGETVENAVEDIITRGVSEIRKNAFGDETGDSRNLPWTREQAWALMKLLSKQPEVSYHEVVLQFPFKNDEAPLRNMEQAELISIGTQNGRPSTISPGKPVYRYVFERLVRDTVFQATQDIAFNEKVIAASESIVKACELELLTLKDVDAGTSLFWGSRRAVSQRTDYLLKKMRIAEEKIEVLEKQNLNLKKILAKDALKG
ncbi:RNA12 protein-domain-containing protein [Sparassis latifolia]|uniref:Mitochondrial escape protein 2 n=1 Tax=Sparassis crispa TaxID=139825 RepID=A0A401GJS4_9APHY|nr:predicted protein [Sparassis crispa]GBE82399.1 predicted protein [Sparassis crispa]